MAEPIVQMTGFDWNFKRNEIIELLLKPIFQSDNPLTQHFNIRRNVKDEVMLNFISAPKRFIQRNDDCEFTPKGKMSLTSNKLKVTRLKVETEHCMKEFFDHCLEIITGQGDAIWDDEATPELKVLKAAMAQQLAVGMINDLAALAWFSDDNNTATTAELSVFFSHLKTNGIFRQLEDKSGITVTEVNAGSGSVLSSQDSVDLLRAMQAAAKPELKKLPKVQQGFHVTSSIYEPYKAYLENLGNYEQHKIVQEGLEGLKFDSIIVIEHPDWDETLTNEFGQTNPNRIIYTAGGNLTAGTDISGDAMTMRFYTDVHMKKLYNAGFMRFGTGIVHDELIVFGK